MVDTRGRAAAAARRRLLELARAAGPPLRRPRRDLGRSRPTAGVRFPEDTDASVERVWQLTPGARDGDRVRRDRAGRGLEVDRPRRDLRAGAGPVGPPAPAGVGRRLRRPGLPHDPAAPDRPRLGDRRALDRAASTRPRDGGGSWSPRNQGIRAEFLPEGQQYPEFGQCVHKVTRHPARPERMYLQNHGGVYRSDDEGGSWTSIADGLPGRLRLPDRGAPARAGHRLRVPDQRRRRALPAARPRPGSGARATPGRPGRSSATGCPTRSTSR